MPEFDPATKINGFNITYGDITLGGDCWAHMPAIYQNGRRLVRLGPHDDRYPQTIELYEKYGARLPDSYYVDELVDVEIGCENYQALVVAGVAVKSCANCPLLKGDQS